MSDPSSRPSVRAGVLAWYRREQRAFPWRGLDDPFAVLVSEVMLQQTQAVRVAERFPAFMAQFPTAEALATAAPAAVLVAWSGLGYNRRAVTLQRAAAEVAANGWPRHVDGLAALPGIGPYTARAVASLAFGVPVGVVDTNVRRWLLRRFSVADRAAPLQQLADDLAAGGRGAEIPAWTHASMEFGAAICTARAPRCGACPISRGCPSRGRAAMVAVPRQAPFPGSDRAYRGAILRRLSAAPGHRRAIDAVKATAASMSEGALSEEGWQRILASLIRDGLVRRSGSELALGPMPPDGDGTDGQRGPYNRAMSLKVTIGDQLPSIGLRATDGYLLNLRSHVTRQPSILLFFGAPTLTGAARERGEAVARAIADGQARLAGAGVGAFGITCDSETQQTEYVAEAKLPLLLLSDERRSAVEALGVPTTRDGTNVNAEPTAIAVGVDGTILDIVERAEPRGLVARLLDAFRAPDADPAPGATVGAPA